MIERKCFSCRSFEHITYNCRNKKIREKSTQMLSNKFEVLMNKMIEVKISSRREKKKDRKTILKKKREKIRRKNLIAVLLALRIKKGEVVKRSNG